MHPRAPWYVIGVVCSTGILSAASVADTSKAAPPPSIPTFSTADIARTGIFYAGGKYVGAPGKEVMGGSAYVEVWVPKQFQGQPFNIFETGGTTGMPKQRIGWNDFRVD